MSKDLIRLMQALFLPGAEVIDQAPWRPPTDVYRTVDGWLIKFELAGVRPDEMDLNVLGNRMTLQGVRRDGTLLHESLAPVHYRMEIAYSQFERTLELPCDLKLADIQTEYKDGMLLVRVIPAPNPCKPPNGGSKEVSQ